MIILCWLSLINVLITSMYGSFASTRLASLIKQLATSFSVRAAICEGASVIKHKWTD